MRTAVVSPEKQRVQICIEYKKVGTIRTESCTFSPSGVWRHTSSVIAEESGYWHPQGRLHLRDGGIWLEKSG